MIAGESKNPVRVKLKLANKAKVSTDVVLQGCCRMHVFFPTGAWEVGVPALPSATLDPRNYLQACCKRF